MATNDMRTSKNWGGGLGKKGGNTMGLAYKTAVEQIPELGLFNMPHQQIFTQKWLVTGGGAGLFEEARRLIRGEREDGKRRDKLRHGKIPLRISGWCYIGCLGNWICGDQHAANDHCLEIMKDTTRGKYFLVDQSAHGPHPNYMFDTTVVCEVPMG
jgi:hypothetical protein